MKALTFRASSIGDTLMGKYFLEEVHAAYPEAVLALVVGSRKELFEDLFRAYPWLTVVEANRRAIGSLGALYAAYRKSDIVLTQYAGKRGGTFSLASKLAARVLARRGSLAGFTDAARFVNSLVYDKLIPFDLKEAPAALERKALAAFTIPVQHHVPKLAYLPNESVLKRFSLTQDGYLIVHGFAGFASRGLSAARQRDLVAAVSKTYPDKEILITGSAKERELARSMAEGIPNARVIAGDTTLQEIMNLMAHARGVISVDTGMAHIAAQLRRPLVVLASCVGLHWWGSEQYEETPIRLFTRSDICAGNHIAQEHPPCLNDINFLEAVQLLPK